MSFQCVAAPVRYCSCISPAQVTHRFSTVLAQYSASMTLVQCHISLVPGQNPHRTETVFIWPQDGTRTVPVAGSEHVLCNGNAVPRGVDLSSTIWRERARWCSGGRACCAHADHTSFVWSAMLCSEPCARARRRVQYHRSANPVRGLQLQHSTSAGLRVNVSMCHSVIVLLCPCVCCFAMRVVCAVVVLRPCA